jgi:hypothetical protein
VKAFPSALLTAIGGTTTTLARVAILISKSGFAVRFTDAQLTVVLNTNTYVPGRGVEISAIQSRNDGTASNCSLTVSSIIGGTIDFNAVASGQFDQAFFAVGVIDYANPAGGVGIIFKGRVGQITLTDRGVAQMQMRGNVVNAMRQVTEKYQPACRADLGDPRCKIPILPPDVQRSTTYNVGDNIRAQSGGTGWANYNNLYYTCIASTGATASTAPTYGTTVGSVTTDGGAQFVAKDAWLRYATVASITGTFTIALNVFEPRAVDGWFAFGGVIWRSGANAGTMVETRAWQASGGVVTIMLPAPGAVAIGDECEIYAGCDLQPSTCVGRFNNINNYRGEPHVPTPQSIGA